MSEIENLLDDPVFSRVDPTKQEAILNAFFKTKVGSVPAATKLRPEVLETARQAFVQRYLTEANNRAQDKALLGGRNATMSAAPKASMGPTPGLPGDLGDSRPPDPGIVQKATDFVKELPSTLKEGAIEAGKLTKDATNQALKAIPQTAMFPAKIARAQAENEAQSFERRGIVKEGMGNPRGKLEAIAEGALRTAFLGGVIDRSEEPRSLKNTLLDILDIGGTVAGVGELAAGAKAMRAAKVLKNVGTIASKLGPEEAQLVEQVAQKLSNESPGAAKILGKTAEADASTVATGLKPSAVAESGGAPAAAEASAIPKLPRELAGAKPRYKELSLAFDSDVDKAAYITAQANKSARDADYLQFAMKATGMDENEVRAYGQSIRKKIGTLEKAGEHDGELLKVPAGEAGGATPPNSGPEVPPVAGGPSAPTADLKPAMWDENGILPEVKRGSKEGPAHALFAYNDTMYDHAPATFNIFGDPADPRVQKLGWGSSVNAQRVEEAGIPVIGREDVARSKVKPNAWEPKGPAEPPPPVEPPGGGAPPPVEPPPPGGTPPPGDNGPLPDLGEFNTKNIIDPKVREAIESRRLDPEVQARIIAEKRGVVSDDELKRMATALDMKPDDLLKLDKGSVLNAEGMYKAGQLLESAGAGVVEVRTKYLEAVANKNVVAQAEAVADMQRLMNPFTDLLVKTNAISSELGRALRARKIVIDKLSDIGKDLMRLSLKEGDVIPPDVAENLLKKLGQTSATDPSILSQIIVKQLKPSLMDKIITLATAFKLTNPVTYVRNLTGNVMAVLTAVSEKTAASPVDLLRTTLAGSPRERFMGEAGSYLIGLRRGLHDAALTFMESWGEVGSKSQEMMKAPAFTGTAGKIINTPFNILNATDNYFKTLLSRGQLHSLAFRQAAQEGHVGAARWARMEELAANPLPEWADAIQSHVLEFTYQTPLGEFGAKLDSLRNSFGGLPKLVIPFFKTPVNIGKFIVQRTPMGVVPYGRNVAALRAGGGAATDAIARMAVGTSLSGLFVWAAMEGYITGSGPDVKDKSLRDLYGRSGWQPHSLHVAGKYYSYSGFDPLASTLGTAADIAFAWMHKGEQPSTDTIAKMGWSLMDNITDQPFLTGVHDFLDALRDERKLGKFVDSFAAGMVVPTGVGMIAREMDPIVRKPEGIVQSIETRVPGLSKNVPPKRNAFGEPITREGTLPVASTEEKHSSLESELTRLNQEVGFKVGFRGNRIAGRKLEQKEYDELQAAAGPVLKAKLEDLVASERYQGLSDPAKVRAIKGLEHAVSERFNDQMHVGVELRALGLPDVGKMGLPQELANTLVSRLKTRIDTKEYKDKPDAARKQAVKEKILDVLQNYQGG